MEKKYLCNAIDITDQILLNYTQKILLPWKI